MAVKKQRSPEEKLVKTLLSRLDMKSEAREYISYYADMAIESAELTLKTKNYSKQYNRSGYTSRHKPDFSVFLENMAEDLPRDLYNAEKLSRMCRDSLKTLALEKDSKLASLMGDEIYAPVVQRYLPEKIAAMGIKSRIIRQVKAHFTQDVILKCLAVNPYTAKDALSYSNGYGRLKELRAAILEKVPAEARDLYPIARRLPRRFIIHSGPTNSGKTYDALTRYREAESGIYLGPLRLLAFEVFESTNEAGVLCSMLTGEEHIDVPFSNHTASTIEMLDTTEHYTVAVIDECQMIADSERGGAWTRAILGVNAEEIHLCCAPNAADILIKMAEYCGDTWELIEHHRRSELLLENEKFSFPADVRDGDALIVFSKRSVQSCAAELQEKGIACSVVYGSLPYDVRQNEVRRFLSGETKVVVATDAIGMGLNLPVDRVVFLETEKFDGTDMRKLRPEEIQQIAGRAGRNDLKPGYVNASVDKRHIREGLETALTPVEFVSLGFPRELLQLDGTVSEIIDNWSGIETHEPFRKSELKNEIKLAEELEKISDDKEKIFNFVMIPFKESDRTLHQDWMRLFKHYNSGRKRSFSELYFYYDPEDLTSMELAYQQNDLMFYYLRLTEQPEEQKLVMREKQQISREINAYLKDHPMEGKKCRSCGRALPWNYRFGICGRCFKYQNFTRGIEPRR